MTDEAPQEQVYLDAAMAALSAWDYSNDDRARVAAEIAEEPSHRAVVKSAYRAGRSAALTGPAVMQVAQKAYIVKDNRLLMVQYGVAGNHDWDLPGGRIEVGESDLDAALVREVREESGLAAQIGEPLVVYLADHSATGRTTMFVIRRVNAIGSVTTAGQVPEDNIAGVSWVPLNKVAELTLNPCIGKWLLALIKSVVADPREVTRPWLAERIHAGHCGCDDGPDPSYFAAADAILNAPDL